MWKMEMGKYNYDEMRCLLLLGRAWEIVAHHFQKNIFIGSIKKEALIEILQSENGEATAQKLNNLSRGYRDLYEIFTEIVPCRHEENEVG